MELLWVGIGGALGAIGRYLVGREFTERVGGLFPWGTFAINITGAFLIGVLFALLTERGIGDDQLRLVFGVGLLGGYTTFSSYALEVVNLVEAGHGGTALIYLLGSNLLGLVACVIGIAMMRWAT